MESKTAETVVSEGVAVVQADTSKGKPALVIPIALLAALLSAAVVLPTLGVRPPLGGERDMAALMEPASPALAYFFPWLTEMDRRLIGFGGTAVFCKLLAQLLFPVLMASWFASYWSQRAATPEDRAAQDAFLASRVKAAWKPWTKVTLGLLLLVGIVNLAGIKWGFAPAFPVYPRKFSMAQDLAMTLPALVALPLCGLLIAALSAAAGKLMKQFVPTLLTAYAAIFVLDYLLGTLTRDMPFTLREYSSAPIWGMQSAPTGVAVWLIYGAMNGLAALLVWYFASPSARQKSQAPTS